MKLHARGKAFAIGCLSVVLVVAGGSAAIAASADSPTGTASANGVSYQAFSRITTGSSADGETWTGPTNKSAPAGWIGSRGRVFNSSDGMTCDSGIHYSGGSVAKGSYYISSCSYSTGGAHYSWGVYYIYNGNGYNPYYTNKSPQLNNSSSAATTSASSAAGTGGLKSAKIRFKTNMRGKTYGAAVGLTDAQLPDLVLAVASNGVAGYVYSSELLAVEGPVASTLQQALAASKNSTITTIPVFDSSGQDKVGVFPVGGSSRVASSASN